jgi:gamma-glutamyltranspeptidase/glutathione hydrolase
MRNLELAGRSPVLAMNGMAATSHPLATLAAINVLQSGGNAMDAAVTACAVQCVIEPQSTGIGGDCFMLYAPAGKGEILAFNGSGRAPAAATAKRLRDMGVETIARQSAHAVTVPGAIDAWSQLLRDHGTRDLGAVLQPAIRYAREGYPVSSRIHSDWVNAAPILSKDPTSKRIFLPNGKAPALGSVHRQPELAATLEIIAAKGRDGFYTGPVAEDIVAHLKSLGGLHSMDDFAAAKGEYVKPISTAYRGYDVYECPPNGQGIIALEILNILDPLMKGLPGPLSVERLHYAIEAARLAYHDRANLIGDPAQVDVPVAKLLSEDYAKQQRARIDGEKAMAELPPGPFPLHPDTVYLCVVDKDGNAVSFINSLFHSFGSGLTAPKTGVVLQNRGDSFNTLEGHANCIAPGKRPMHTIIPGMLVKDGRAVMPFGVMGGHFQAMGHAWFLTNYLDFDLDLQEAMDLPRLFPVPGGPVEIESGVPADVVAALQACGHKTAPTTRPIGGAQGIWIDHAQGVLTGASEPRKDGCALGY